MSHSFKPQFKLGILGGGQLARMLALSAHKWGVQPWIYSENPADPAQQVSSFGMTGSLSSRDQLKSFLSQVDMVTFESEFLDAKLLEELSEQTQCPISPSPQVMGTIQDRLTQKMLLDQYHIATAPWKNILTAIEAQQAAQIFSFPLVFKKRRFGYDGYGTFVVRDQKALDDFCKQQFPNNDGYIAEKFIPFKRELACMFARRVGVKKNDEVVHYPLVESLQENSRCLWVKGPIQTPRFKSWANSFKKLLTKINYVGVIGVELFDTKKGLIVNELAPRVHNSGHYTQDAFSLNQFDMHILALLNQPLALPKSPKGFAMVNLLGENSSNKNKIGWDVTPGINVHWYGKAESRPGRKMGHINVLDSTPEKALKAALKARKGFTV